MLRKVAFDPRCVYLAAGLRLQVFVATYMICVGVRIVYRSQLSAICVEMLLYLLAGIFIIAAVDDAHFIRPCFDKTYLRRALNIEAAICNADQFIHNFIPPAESSAT